ncbi:major histocompatibility complex class I-related gene protein [Nematolebias whitei]|uniref:major histocompatibility complex class I-related gene protein n=1 Tax=Nematolebias whitei TaxID=451745 RepID=UPI00189B936F|nr:major histocompatibility complex class I-related gene protein [Nematolebias whitei]
MTQNLGQEYEEQQTNVLRSWVQTFKGNIAIVMDRFNQSKGVHIFQNMYGCEWDDETDQAKGFNQFGYDGEDFIALDLKTESYVAAKQQAEITKHKWDNNKAGMEYLKNYFVQECPEWLKKYLNYGRSSLMRTALPSVSLLQKTSSSPVCCHATGFYPEKAELLWRKDGEEIHENVDKGEILPNNDGTFQMSAELSSVAAEDWSKYECVFQLRGEEDVVKPLDHRHIRSNEANLMTVIIPVVAAAAALAVVAVIAFVLYRKRNAKRPPSPVEKAEVQQQMLPEA